MSGLLGDQWSMAVRNLKRNKRRNFATGIAIGLGFAALVALGGYINRAEGYLRAYTIYALRTGHVVVYKRNGLERFSVKPRDFSLTADDQNKIKEVLGTIPEVQLYGPQLLGQGLIGNGCKAVPFIATGIDPALDHALKEQPEMIQWSDRINVYSKGKELAAYPPELGAVALADGLARLLHKQKVHDDFPPDQKVVIVSDCLAPNAREQISSDANVQLAAGSWSGMLSSLDGEVVATYNPGNTETMNAGMLTSVTHLQKLYDTENATLFSIWLKDGRETPTVVETLRQRLGDAGLAVDVYPWNDEAVSPMYTGTMQFLYTMVTFIAVVLATVVVFSIFNSATMTVIERSQEIGMMRSLGFKRGEIRRLFVREMVALALVSVVGGGIVAIIGILAVNGSGVLLKPPGVSGGMLLKLVPNTLIVSGATVLIFALAVLTTLLAVRNMARRNIATLLMGSQR